jgi:hypothetical protein
VLLDSNETGVVTGAPLLVLGLAVKSCVDPRFSDTMLLGDKPTLAGTGKMVTLVGLVPLQPIIELSTNKAMMNPTIKERNDLPMHPPHLLSTGEHAFH